jgi:FAD/FMN-containing dehydrogenase
MVVCYNGDPDAGRAAMAPLLTFGPPAVDLVQPMPYVEVQRLIDAPNPGGLRNYWSADFLRELPDEAVEVLVDRATRPVSPLTQVLLAPGGGAMARVSENATAFGQRTAPWNVHYLGVWEDPADDEANIESVREMSAATKPWSTGRVYLNYIGDEGSERVAAAFGREKYARLQHLKLKWDPHNLFRHNQNITPAVIEQRRPE